MSRHGSPAEPVGPRISLHMRRDQLEELDRLATERGTSRSALIREAVDRLLRHRPRAPR